MFGGGSREGSIRGTRSATFGRWWLFRRGGGRRSCGVRVRLIFFGGFFRDESSALEQLQNLRVAADLGNLANGSFTSSCATRRWSWWHIRLRFGKIRVDTLGSTGCTRRSINNCWRRHRFSSLISRSRTLLFFQVTPAGALSRRQTRQFALQQGGAHCVEYHKSFVLQLHRHLIDLELFRVQFEHFAVDLHFSTLEIAHFVVNFLHLVQQTHHRGKHTRFRNETRRNR